MHLPEPEGTPVSTRTDDAVRLYRVRDELNKLLVDVMEGREKPGSASVFTRILGVSLGRFDQLHEGVWAYIATLAAQDLLRSGTSTAQAVAAHIGRLFASLDYNTSLYTHDFAQLRLGGESARLNLMTVKRSGITSDLVRAAEASAADRFRARERARIEKDGGKDYPLPSIPRGFSGPYARTVSKVADMRAKGDPGYIKYLAPFEHAKFPAELFPRPHVLKLIQEARDEIEGGRIAGARGPDGVEFWATPAATRQNRLAFLDQFGESALVMACLRGFMAEIAGIARDDFDYYAKCHDSEGLPRALDSVLGYPRYQEQRDRVRDMEQRYRFEFDHHRVPFCRGRAVGEDSLAHLRLHPPC